ncbi:MAG: NAD-dependent malic enzyme [Chlamydiales bacterium]|jgi:malate dehydrogenase (oxaloacetate-decarboxylating)|nr:NAD-dependent malic enzyme [Chlamydiales bacterium]
MSLEESPSLDQQSIALHEEHHGKIALALKIPLNDRHDLSLAYSPGVAAPCRDIHQNPERVFDLTTKRNTVAVVSDGSAVLGLGNIGPLAALPVMEGKALLFKKYADIDAWPICLDATSVEEIVQAVKSIAPGFGAINLEDISAPRCFAVEDALQSLGIPVFHDDQHGTAIVVLAALINACKVLGKDFSSLKVVVNGAGAAGIAIARMLCKKGYEETTAESVREIILCDTKGIISNSRTDLNEAKKHLLTYSNRENISGTVFDALKGADVFIGVSQGDLLKAEDIRLMSADAIVFALANPIPEIMPEEAYRGGAAIVGTGRSDLPNQVNNVLAFPGLFRGALDARAKQITPLMKVVAAQTLAALTKDLSREHILPSPLDAEIAPLIGKAVQAVV